MMTTEDETYLRKVERKRRDCELSELYHEHREGFLSRAHRILLFIIIASSAVVATGADVKDPFFPGSLLILPAIVASLDLVFNLSGAAQEHRFLRLRFAQLAAELCAPDLDEPRFALIPQDKTTLHAEEPPVYRALLYVCTNLIDARYKHDGPRLLIPWWRRRLMNLLRFNSFEPSYLCKG